MRNNAKSRQQLYTYVIIFSIAGTIDKCYPKTKGGYSFEIGDPAFEKIIQRVRPKFGWDYAAMTCCTLDSKDITDEHR